jgi:hypothetical protein
VEGGRKRGLINRAVDEARKRFGKRADPREELEAGQGLIERDRKTSSRDDRHERRRAPL